jgi:hypothetical protein
MRVAYANRVIGADPRAPPRNDGHLPPGATVAEHGVMQKPLIALVAVVLAPGLAHAGPAETAAEKLGPIFNMLPTMRDDPGSRAESVDHDPKAADCDAAVAAARKAGLADDARIVSTYLTSSLPEVHYDDKQQAYVTLGEAAAICAEYKQLQLIMPAAWAQTQTAQEQDTFTRLVEPGELDNAQRFGERGKACLAATDKAIKAGAPGDRKVKIFDKQLSLTEGRTQVCQAMIDWAGQLGGKIKEAHDADREKREAPYKAVGIAGAKLDLMVEYDDVYWRGGKNCEIVSDVKALKKATKLFHWLENSDGTHTIRKYTFSGNKVTGTKTTTYKRAEDAKRGCK